MAGERILLVEDNEVLRDGLKSLLEQERYVVMAACQGLEALEQMDLAIPDLILADIIMPEMDGFAFLERVRSRPEWMSIPFVFLSARRERKYVMEGKKLGVEDYLTKPISPDELLTTIRSWLGRSHQILLAQIQESYEASLIMLANAIEVRDPYTRGHVERVMNYSLVIAEGMGWSKANLNQLRFGSILHDIGKIHVAAHILRKRGPLSDEEWIELRKHPQVGVELVRGVPYLAPAIPVILSHHERWDGSGYPHGLKGEDIPLAARIVAVADSLDAMTTMRPYREVLKPGQACGEIVLGSGVQYDPAIVGVFQQAWEANQMQAILAAFPGA